MTTEHVVQEHHIAGPHFDDARVLPQNRADGLDQLSGYWFVVGKCGMERRTFGGVREIVNILVPRLVVVVGVIEPQQLLCLWMIYQGRSHIAVVQHVVVPPRLLVETTHVIELFLNDRLRLIIRRALRDKEAALPRETPLRVLARPKL